MRENLQGGTRGKVSVIAYLVSVACLLAAAGVAGGVAAHVLQPPPPPCTPLQPLLLVLLSFAVANTPSTPVGFVAVSPPSLADSFCAVSVSESPPLPLLQLLLSMLLVLMSFVAATISTMLLLF